jgi:large subunit ribosomal protein L24
MTPGRFVEMEKSVHVSNVAVLDPETKKPTRVGFSFEGSKKIRISKKSGKSLVK